MTTAKPQPRYLPTLTDVVRPPDRVAAPVAISPATGTPPLADLKAELRSTLQLIVQEQIQEFATVVEQKLDQAINEALDRFGKAAGN
jgi:hypothetical protein